MNNIKVVHKNGLCLIHSKLKNEKADMQLVEWLMNHRVDGVIPGKVEETKKGIVLTYHLSGFITLKNYLKQILDRNRFAILLDSLLSVIVTGAQNDLHYSNYLLDLTTIVINPGSGRASVLYYPVEGYNNNKMFPDILEEILKNLRTSKKENKNYLNELKHLLSQPDGRTWEALRAYTDRLLMQTKVPLQNMRETAFSQGNVDKGAMNRINGNGGVRNQIDGGQSILGQVAQNENTRVTRQCPVCGFTNIRTARFCEKCGSFLTPEQTKTSQFPEIPSEGTTVLYEDSTNEEDTDGTTLLTQMPVKRRFPYLIRVSTNEKIVLDKDCFKLGKGSMCDYTITGNSAVSRIHAEIIYEDGAYYLIDDRSTNKTYMNQVCLIPMTKYRLDDQADIMLGNEELIFSNNTMY